MIRWRQIVASFAIGAAAGAAAVRWWRGLGSAEPVEEMAPDDAPEIMPLPWDPRWHQVPCEDPVPHACSATWLRAGVTTAIDPPAAYRLFHGEVELSGTPAAQRYVELVHTTWRSRKAVVN